MRWFHRFRRTVCACHECRACCRRQPGPLAPGDFETIAQHLALLGQTEAETRVQFVASPGSLVLDQETGRTFRIGSITPRRVRGRCVFLDQDERCRIHAVAPFGCAFFDTHQTWEVSQERAAWLARAMQDDAYQALRSTLPFADGARPREW